MEIPRAQTFEKTDMTNDRLDHYRIGAELARYVRTQTGRGSPPLSALQAVVTDLAATTPNLAIPLRDVVTRQGFQPLIPLAGSGRGDIHLKALVDDVHQLYNPNVVQALVEVLDGFLERRGEATPSIKESSDASARIPNASKKAERTNKGEYSFKNAGSDDVRRFQRGETRAMEMLQNAFMDRQQYAEREIDSLLKKSEQGGDERSSKNITENEARVIRGAIGSFVEVLAAGSIITLVFVYGARPADRPAAAAIAFGTTSLLALGSNAARKGR